ncbi:MAG TPA: alpha/beta hydrolase [Acidimicrobiales bacterium]|nr:alpha/beta hydrolase [Acidimicrobiales bacterium]
MIDRLEIDANDLTFTARASGPEEGRRVLLLHGFPQTSWAWRAQLTALGEAGYRAVAPDLRGYSIGARPPEVTDYGLEHLVDDVMALADTMEMTVFDLIGHDWGGLLAWVVASRFPDRVRSLCAISTPHPHALRHALTGADPQQALRSASLSIIEQPDLVEHLLLGEEGWGSGLGELFLDSGLDASQTQEYLAVLSRPGAMTAALNWFRAMGDDDLADLPTVVVPTLYVWSSGDAVLGRVAAEATADYVGGLYEFAELEGVSHWIPELAPDELNHLLLRHLWAT